jgi:hypothetical protein
MEKLIQILMLVCMFLLTLSLLDNSNTDLCLLGMGYVLIMGILLVSITEKK